MYFLEKGEVVLITKKSQIIKLTQKKSTPGDYFGEMSLVSYGQRSEDAIVGKMTPYCFL